MSILNEAQQRAIVNVAPNSNRIYSKCISTLEVIEATLQMLKKGGEWRALPKQYGNPLNLFCRFVNWELNDSWRPIAEILRDDPKWGPLIFSKTPRKLKPHTLSNAEWKYIDKNMKPPRQNDWQKSREFVDKILFVARNDISLADWPARLSQTPESLLKRYYSWQQKYNFWDRLAQAAQKEPLLADLFDGPETLPNEFNVLHRTLILKPPLSS